VWQRPISRRDGEVQFGVLPDGPIVTGVTPTEVALLAGLDGVRPLEATCLDAQRAGVASQRWRALLDLLADLGLLHPPAGGAAVPRPRIGGDPCGLTSQAVAEARPPRRHVVIDGDGSLVEDIVSLIRRSGVEEITHGRHGVDRVIADPCSHDVDLVIIVGPVAVDPRRGDLWLRHRVPHLPVVPAGSATTVGPLVGAGDGPCLWCLDLHRTDRDQAWPTLMAQVCADAGVVVPDAARAQGELEPALAQLVAGSVALFTTRLLAGERPPAGVSVEISLPWPRMDHRRWTPHPLCLRHESVGPVGSTGHEVA
jgi:hypothetical protein